MTKKCLSILIFMIGLLLSFTNSCKKDDPIIKKDVTITWDKPADITIGIPLSATQLNAKAYVAGTLVYTPAIGTVLNLGASQNLKVDFTPTDAANYNAATKTVTINVIAKEIPYIIWANPKDILPGTPLSATQLNATTEVAGSFIYTPAIGTVLSLGVNQDLKVDFTPTDASNYNVASKTVKINVRQGVSSVVFKLGLTYGTMTDQEGNVYKTITIGTQTWMAENLRVTKYRNGDPLPNLAANAAWAASTTGAYCSYENMDNIDEITTYGRLYNWYAVSDSRNIAPTGWHIPTDAEWTTLTTALFGENIAGGKMKETGTTHWSDPNKGATNESGFSAIPAGYRDNYTSSFKYRAYHCFYWSSILGNASCNWDSAQYFYGYWDHNFVYERMGFSVRCVRD